MAPRRNGPPGPGKNRKGRGRSQVSSEVREAAERLVAQSGLPRPMAFQVASGALTLNDAIHLRQGVPNEAQRVVASVEVELGADLAESILLWARKETFSGIECGQYV